MKIFYTLTFLFFFSALSAQNFNGQWKGGFRETSTGYAGMADNGIDYVLELQAKGADVTGYSYTYFREGGKRYFTICRVTGSVNRASRDILVTEVERVKYNTPPNFMNCFQTHKLHYEKVASDSEVLRGSWVPAPDQSGNCGYGTTLLSRRVIRKLPMGIASAKKPASKPDAPRVTTPSKSQPSQKPPVAKAEPRKEQPSITKTQVDKPTERAQEKPVITEEPVTVTPLPEFKNRRKDIIRTIPIESGTFNVDFYDNGEIDGDSISVFYNGKVILSHKKLTDKPLSLKLNVDKPGENVITMYAENLGTIPPNTALMIVTDGDKRYEVRITSDTEKSGSVIFVHKQ